MSKKLGLTTKQILLLPTAVIFNFGVYEGGRLLAAGQKHHSLFTGLDQQIPCIPWTILIYWGCYVFWIINYYLCVRYDKGKGYRFFVAHFIGELICFLFFCIISNNNDKS